MKYFKDVWAYLEYVLITAFTLSYDIAKNTKFDMDKIEINLNSKSMEITLNYHGNKILQIAIYPGNIPPIPKEDTKKTPWQQVKKEYDKFYKK
jgi:hypothetical protein